MYSLILLLHSWLRWAVLLAGFVVVARALARGGRPWTPTDERAGSWFVITLDLQLLLGALLYFALSPIMRLAFDDFGAAMRTSGIRFWAVEHLFGMVIGIALAHVGKSRIRKAATDARRHRLALIFFGLALLAVLVSIPWPAMPNGRPLFRW
jgi:cell division protein FtsW (lipid II flippase)